ncbi:14981_t:CDS:1, partial [Dentiscutata erythropus]
YVSKTVGIAQSSSGVNPELNCTEISLALAFILPHRKRYKFLTSFFILNL